MPDFVTVSLPTVEGDPFVPDEWVQEDPAVARQIENWTRSGAGLTWWRDEMRRGRVFRLPAPQIEEDSSA